MHTCLDSRRSAALASHGRPRTSLAVKTLRSCSAVRSSPASGEQLVVHGKNYDEIIDQLAHQALDAAQALPDNSIYLVGIAGGPGSGKSTLAQHVAQHITQLCQQRGLSRTAVVAPMDGFHYYKHQLDKMPDPQEAYARRGAHWTFDGEAFLDAIRRIKQHGSASLPSFDHGVGDPIEDDVVIDSSRHAVVLVEGNYLLLDVQPWLQLRSLFDDTWFVDCPIDLAMQRVFERQVGIGLPPEESRKRIAGNDRPNGELINASKGAARVLVPSNVPFAQQATGAGTHTQAIQAAVAAAEE